MKIATIVSPSRRLPAMGFERIVSILQGVDSNYKTDLFLPLVHKTPRLTGYTDAEVEENLVAYRSSPIMRASSFLIADAALPGNFGRNLRDAATLLGREIDIHREMSNGACCWAISRRVPDLPQHSAFTRMPSWTLQNA